MQRPDSFQKLAWAAFITTSALLIIAGAVWGIRLLTSLHSQASTTTPLADLAVGGFPMSGDLAPDFTLTDQFGHTVTLSSLRGHEVVLAFIDSQCITLCPLTAEIMYDAKARLSASQPVRYSWSPSTPILLQPAELRCKPGPSNTGCCISGYSLQEQHNNSSPSTACTRYMTRLAQTGAVVHDPTMFIIDAKGRERLYFETLDSNSQSDLVVKKSG